MRFTFIFIVLIILLNSARAQNNPSPARLIQQGWEKFQAGDYQTALVKFDSLISIPKNNPYLDAGLYLSAKTYTKLGNQIPAFKALTRLITEFPQSQYIDDAYFLQAEVFYSLGKDENSYLKLLRLMEANVDPRLKSLATEKLNLLLGPMNKNQLLDLKVKSSPAGKVFIEELINARKGMGKIIVLAAPEDSGSQAIIKGMQIALDRFNAGPENEQPDLQAVNVEGELLDIYLLVKNLSTDEVCAVVSLLNGENSIIAASAGSNFNLPFYILQDDSPGLWRMGDNIWQLTPTLKTMGTKTAEFAFSTLGLRRFVLLSPLDDVRGHFADAFIQRALELEAEIAAQEWYYLDDHDLGKNFKNLRNLGFKIQFDDSMKALLVDDSLYVSPAVAQVLSKEYKVKIDTSISPAGFTGEMIDTTIYRVRKSILNSAPAQLSGEEPQPGVSKSPLEQLLDRLWSEYRQSILVKARFQRVAVDSNDIPLHCYDGFIFPLSEEEVDMYVPQFAYYNFTTQLFTLKSAFNPVNLGKNGRYLGKMIAVGWGVPEAKNPDFIQMTKYLNLSTSTTVVNETLALGYDAADLICNLTAEFKKQKQKSLEQNFTFKGAYYSFNFLSGNRSNQQVDFFRYDGKGFIPIQAPASFKSR